MPFADSSTRFARCAVLALLGAVLAACGASAPPKADAEERSIVAPAAAAAPAPAPQDEERRGERRRSRRGDDETAAKAAPPAGEPVPEPVLQVYERALAAMHNENWLEAELTLEQLMLEHPGYPGPYVNLAIIYRQDKRNADARVMLDQALAIDAGHPSANNQLGILLRNQGRFSEAEAAYERALVSDPDYALAHYNLAVLLDVYLRRQAEALEHYELYQSSLAEPDEKVGRWIIDLRRRLGISGNASRVAQGDGT